MNLKELIFECFNELNVPIDENKAEKFLKYKELLLEWNEKMNLTAITEDEDIIIKHFADSVSSCTGLDMKDGMSVIDVGTGAGFPGLPVKIIYPEIKLTLVDSLNKRVNFLSEVVNQLDLRDVECIHSRAEDLGKDNVYRETFDVCLSRAVANLSVLSEYCLPFVKKGGYFVSLKGPDVNEELNSAAKSIGVLGGKTEKILKINIPKSDITHTLIMIKKISQTPTKYPRKPGVISKNPIK